MQAVFIHGLHGNSQGAKARYFAGRYPSVLLPDFTGDLEHRLTGLRALLAGQDNLVLVGSSFGGLMATIFALEAPTRLRRLVLLAPALNSPEFAPWQGRTCGVETHLYVGTEDEITPAAALEPVARATFNDLHFTVLADDHRLQHTFTTLPWPTLLG